MKTGLAGVVQTLSAQELSSDIIGFWRQKLGFLASSPSCVSHKQRVFARVITTGEHVKQRLPLRFDRVIPITPCSQDLAPLVHSQSRLPIEK